MDISPARIDDHRRLYLEYVLLRLQAPAQTHDAVPATLSWWSFRGSLDINEVYPCFTDSAISTSDERARSFDPALLFHLQRAAARCVVLS